MLMAGPLLSVRKLAVFDTWSALAVHIAMDNTVVMDDIRKWLVGPWSWVYWGLSGVTQDHDVLWDPSVREAKSMSSALDSLCWEHHDCIWLLSEGPRASAEQVSTLSHMSPPDPGVLQVPILLSSFSLKNLPELLSALALLKCLPGLLLSPFPLRKC